MPTKRKGASKHRQSRRSRRHSRRSVRGAGKSTSSMKKPSSMKSMNSSLRGITKLEPSHAVNYVKNMPFKLIGIGKRSDLQLFTGNFQMKDGNAHYLPGGFVFWRGDDEARKIGGWYQVKKFDPITNMPEGPAYRVESNEDGPIIGTNGRPTIVDEEGHVIGSPDTPHLPGFGHAAEDVGMTRRDLGM